MPECLDDNRFRHTFATVKKRLAMDACRGKKKKTRHWCRHEIGMWKYFSFSNGGNQCLNIKNVTKSMELSKILLTFVAELEQTEKNGCVEGSNGWAYWMSSWNRNVEVSNSTKTTAILLTLWDYCILPTQARNDIPFGVGYCMLLVERSFHNLYFGDGQ